MAKNFPSPFEILGVPSPKELFNEYVNLKKQLENLKKTVVSQGKKITRLETKIAKLVKQPKRKRKRVTEGITLKKLKKIKKLKKDQ